MRSAYEHTRVFASFDEFLVYVGQDRGDRAKAPRAFVVGSPPMFRGTTQRGRDIELRILDAFPGVALFVEKPVATGPREEIGEVFEVARRIRESGSVCSVG